MLTTIPATQLKHNVNHNSGKINIRGLINFQGRFKRRTLKRIVMEILSSFFASLPHCAPHMLSNVIVYLYIFNSLVAQFIIPIAM